MKAVLALEDGTIFEGRSLGAPGEKVGRVVFHTGVVGYQELITDPSYRGLLLCMSYPLIGNYGINQDGYESDRAQAEALIVKENSRIYSNWLAKGSLEDFMRENGVVGIEGMDTRGLVIHIREKGEMRGVVSTKDLDRESLIKKAKDFSYKGRDLVKEVTPSKISPWEPLKNPKYKIVMLDLGTNFSLLNALKDASCEVMRVPAYTKAEQILELNPQAIVLSSGPEDSDSLSSLAQEVKKLLGKKPLWGIASGNLVLGLALGGKIKRLKFGHHGVNQPVRALTTGKADITIQNHSYVIDEKSVKETDLEVININMNDKSIEGIRSKKYKAMGLQYFPANFDSLLEMVK